jgi:hypothetical protein
MLDITMENDTVTVGQHLTHPSVYLDHWALLDFLKNEELCTRLTNAIHDRNGTLTLSWLNLLEFSRLIDADQARKAERLFERNLPRLFCIEIQPFRVIAREDEYLAGHTRYAPHSNDTLLQQIVSKNAASPVSVYPFSVHNLFLFSQDPEFAKSHDGVADTAIQRIEAMRDELATDPSFEDMVRNLPSGPSPEAGTRYAIRELLRGMLLNQRMVITRNHAIDLFHAVVPVSYCDFVLLDYNWEAQVAQMRKRMLAAGMSFPVAKIYSKKANGVERFLKELETA